MKPFVCIHGHFYQPPRENPWLETIESQDSAYPFHDWNERITDECYAPNAASRILTPNRRILNITNNYSKISFNFGPSLLSWMKEAKPRVYQHILDADRESLKNHDGHGSAMAQAYSHMIMPLANERDKETQVIWGRVDFEKRFGRPPQGMWLPETAVDLSTLCHMAQNGIRFTILEPSQAKQFRKFGEKAWKKVEDGKIDTTHPYLCKLGPDLDIVLFFYDGSTSRAVAFEKLLADGPGFAKRILSSGKTDKGDHLLHIATDGETYGHHHEHGDMALAYALDYIEREELGKVTNYSAYLANHAPTYEVEIIENTSWSCAHGIERWRSNCGCQSGENPDWSQSWRGPLRESLDWLRDEIVGPYEETVAQYLRDPWHARNDYINVILDRSPASLSAFLERNASHELSLEEEIQVWKLMELQRNAMLMYTSCGWFFDELSGIETVQILKYASRVIQLAEDLTRKPFHAEFLDRMENASSNLDAFQNGRDVFEKCITPAMADLERVGAHFAISHVLDRGQCKLHAYAHRISIEDRDVLESGKAKLATGLMKVTSDITKESIKLGYAVLHFGDHNLSAAVRPYKGEETFEKMSTAVKEPFLRGDFPNTLRKLDESFEEVQYSLRSLFRDEQKETLENVLKSQLEAASEVHEQLYNDSAPTIRFLRDLQIPVPKVFLMSAEVILNEKLVAALKAQDFDLFHRLFKDALELGVSIDSKRLGKDLQERMEHDLQRIEKKHSFTVDWNRILTMAKLIQEYHLPVNLWRTENIYFRVSKTLFREVCGGEKAQTDASCIAFIELGQLLRIKVAE